jgi:hypothetical protein
MNCKDLAPLLDELIDGTLDERRASAVRGHLRTCAACTARLEETQGIVEQLGGLEPLDPPPALWQRIDARLAGEQVADSKRGAWWWWWQAWRRPLAWSGALAAACGVALIIYVVKRPAPERMTAEHLLVNPTPVKPEEPQKVVTPTPTAYDLAVQRLGELDGEYVKAVADLKQAAKEERVHWKPEVAKAFDQNLAVIDAAVDKQRDLARKQPGDASALDALHESYDRQVAFLQEAVIRGEVTP